jgi:hypothetical protein
MRQVPQPASIWGQCSVGPAKSEAPTHQTRPSRPPGLVSLSSRTLALLGIAQPGPQHLDAQCIGDAGPRRMAWAFAIRSEKEVAVCASLTNDRRLLSLAGDLSRNTRGLP